MDYIYVLLIHYDLVLYEMLKELGPTIASSSSSPESKYLILPTSRYARHASRVCLIEYTASSKSEVWARNFLDIV